MTISPCAEAARTYVRYGWSVLPLQTPIDGGCSCRRPGCPAVGKHPRVPWQQWMTRRPDDAQVEAWWSRWTDANVGVVTGELSGVVVLDLDPRSGGAESFAGLVERCGELPPTPEVLTGGGGRHYWLAASGKHLPSVRLADGLDLKAEGGLVVAPPSSHASGSRYEWLSGRSPEDVPLAPVPDAVSALARVLPGADGIGRRAEPSPRTESEQVEFAEAWARAGVELTAGDRYYCCPFHDDRHPSLHVDAEGCRWFCFGCRRGGGIGRLLQLLGEEAEPRPRARLRGQVGRSEPVTLADEVSADVVGESFHQDELLRLSGGRRPYGGVELEAVAELVPDLDPERPGSVSVLLDGVPVGQLRREDIERLRPAIAEARVVYGAATCRAVIRGGWDRGRDDIGQFGVTVYVPSA